MKHNNHQQFNCEADEPIIGLNSGIEQENPSSDQNQLAFMPEYPSLHSIMTQNNQEQNDLFQQMVPQTTQNRPQAFLDLGREFSQLESLLFSPFESFAKKQGIKQNQVQEKSQNENIQNENQNKLFYATNNQVQGSIEEKKRLNEEFLQQSPKNIPGNLLKFVLKKYGEKRFEKKINRIHQALGITNSHEARLMFTKKANWSLGLNDVVSILHQEADQPRQRSYRRAFLYFYQWSIRKLYSPYLLCHNKIKKKEAYLKHKNMLLYLPDLKKPIQKQINGLAQAINYRINTQAEEFQES